LDPRSGDAVALAPQARVLGKGWSGRSQEAWRTATDRAVWR